MGKTYGLENYVTALDAEGNVRTVTLDPNAHQSGLGFSIDVIVEGSSYCYVADPTIQGILPLGGILVDGQKKFVPVGEFKPEIQKLVLAQVAKSSHFVVFAFMGQTIIDLADRIKEAAKP